MLAHIIVSANYLTLQRGHFYFGIAYLKNRIVCRKCKVKTQLMNTIVNTIIYLVNCAAAIWNKKFFFLVLLPPTQKSVFQIEKHQSLIWTFLLTFSVRILKTNFILMFSQALAFCGRAKKYIKKIFFRGSEKVLKNSSYIELLLYNISWKKTWQTAVTLDLWNIILHHLGNLESL